MSNINISPNLNKYYVIMFSHNSKINNKKIPIRSNCKENTNWQNRLHIYNQKQLCIAIIIDNKQYI